MVGTLLGQGWSENSQEWSGIVKTGQEWSGIVKSGQG